MVLILLNWLVVFLFASLSGVVVNHYLKITHKNAAFVVLIGIIFQTLFLSVCAIFYKINAAVFALNGMLLLVLFLKFKKAYFIFLKSLFSAFTKLQLVLFLILVILTALKSAQLPSIFDNESYYVQTIKWLNEYGFVKGVANVHPFLGQFSFWHVLQSGFNFSFLAHSFNDINGFLLLVVVYFYFEKHIENPFNWSFFGILFLIFYFQFIDAPSPDLPILLFSSIVFFEHINQGTETKSVLLFIVFMIFIKVTIAPLALIALFYCFRNKKIGIYFSVISFFFGTLWVLKNIIISGLPLFPLTFFPTNFDWQMKIEVLKTLTQATIDAGYTENLMPTANFSLIEKLKFWWNLKGLNSFFNKGIVFLFLLMPFTPIFKTNQNFKFLYFVLVGQFVFILVTSPQYRFFLPTFILFFTWFIFYFQKIIQFFNVQLTCFFGIACLVVNLFVDFRKLEVKQTIQVRQLFIPEGITQYTQLMFQKKSIRNFHFYDPDLDNFYETANGNLPCVNENLIFYYNYLPQQRTDDIKDGFCFKEWKNE